MDEIFFSNHFWAPQSYKKRFEKVKSARLKWFTVSYAVIMRAVLCGVQFEFNFQIKRFNYFPRRTTTQDVDGESWRIFVEWWNLRTLKTSWEIFLCFMLELQFDCTSIIFKFSRENLQLLLELQEKKFHKNVSNDR